MDNLTLQQDGQGYWVAKVSPAAMENIWRTGVIDFPFIDKERQLLRFHLKSGGGVERNLWLIWENAIQPVRLPTNVERAIDAALAHNRTDIT